MSGSRRLLRQAWRPYLLSERLQSASSWHLLLKGDTVVLGERSFFVKTLTAWKSPDAQSAYTLEALLLFLQYLDKPPIEYLKAARQSKVERVPFTEREVRRMQSLVFGGAAFIPHNSVCLQDLTKYLTGQIDTHACIQQGMPALDLAQVRAATRLPT